MFRERAIAQRPGRSPSDRLAIAQRPLVIAEAVFHDRFDRRQRRFFGHGPAPWISGHIHLLFGSYKQLTGSYLVVDDCYYYRVDS